MIIRSGLFLNVVYAVFGLALLVQLFYYIYFYLRFCLFAGYGRISPDVPVSVIICARNEEDNLRKFLPAVLEQEYSGFEVIVVNDCSEDNSFEVLGEYLARYPHLKVSSITRDPKFTHNKKFAQFIGIKAAKNDALLFTDADCKPETNRWLSGMASVFDKKTDFVLGYGGYFKDKGLLNKYIRYESMIIAMQYFGMALRGMPYMGVGRNLAYKKSVFFRNRGFSSHNHIISGDDDLFVNANAGSENTRVEYSPETHTRSVPSPDIKTWFKQKRRHLTTAVHYKFRDRIILVAEPASRVLFYVSAIILLVKAHLLPFVVAGLIIRMTTQVVIYSMAQKRLNEPGLLFSAIIFDIFSPFINLLVYFSNYHKSSCKSVWK